MKKIVSLTMGVLLVLAAAILAVSAGEQMPPPVTHSKDFEKMKELVGVWEGTSDMGKEPEPLKVIYELTSGGNAVIERFAAGTPHEMITVYHDYNGKLTLTHYCTLGNQPHMELSKSGGNTLTFVLSRKAPGIVSMKEMHMHAHTLTFDGKDSITQSWTLFDKGAKKNEHTVKLARTKI